MSIEKLKSLGSGNVEEGNTAIKLQAFAKYLLAGGLALAATSGPAMAETVLHSFLDNGFDGGRPQSGLIKADGTFYGATEYGGTFGKGTIYSITPDGIETVLYSFGERAEDGAFPMADLLAVDGVLYGTTMGGSTADEGTVFELKRDGTEHVVHSFAGIDGDGVVPSSALIDVNGGLYGTTAYGGTYGYGTVFSVASDGTETVLYSFMGYRYGDGADTYAGLVDLDNVLYGTTYNGGENNAGTIFAVTLGGAESVLYSFGSVTKDGQHPYSALTDLNGTLYGTTYEGGVHSDGTVFSITASGTYNMLHSFGGVRDLFAPYASLTAADGTLYGTAPNGGTGGQGGVYSITPSGTETVLYNFDGKNGSYPYGDLLAVGNAVYSTTYQGGTSNYGTVFKLMR